MDLRALFLSGTYCHRTGSGPPSCAKPRQPTIYTFRGFLNRPSKGTPFLLPPPPFFFQIPLPPPLFPRSSLNTHANQVSQQKDLSCSVLSWAGTISLFFCLLQEQIFFFQVNEQFLELFQKQISTHKVKYSLFSFSPSFAYEHLAVFFANCCWCC